MELTRIEIKDYKSIKSPITVSFSKGMPTILIGKNGSGKTNILEALVAIGEANSGYYQWGNKPRPTYRAYIQLSKEDVETLLPNSDIVYDRSRSEIVAESLDDDLKIERIYSDYLVPELKKEVKDIRELALQLQEEIDAYEELLLKFSHEEREELPIHCYKIKNKNGIFTPYDRMRRDVEYFIKEIRENCDDILQHFDDNESAFNFIVKTELPCWRSHYKSFRLEYVEPSLALFEQKFISIDRDAIKDAIDKINEKTESSCERIDQLIKEIAERTCHIQKEMCGDYDSWILKQQEKDKKYKSFLTQVKHIIGRKCEFLRNESHNVIFKKSDSRDLDYRTPSRVIAEAYLKQVFDEDILKERLSKSEITLSDEERADFEVLLNKNIPSFDKDMYESISVSAEAGEPVSIFLNEKTGERINLNETSAGRRWYFTYYFMKNILSAGDIFIIDEPAAMLHPIAQREVLRDLMELTKRGVKVVYSTHSPYLIPDEWQCVHFVTMTDEGTVVNGVSSNQELVSQMTSIVGKDIFDIQDLIEKYLRCPPEKIAKNISQLIRNTIEERNRDLKKAVDDSESAKQKLTLQKACEEMNIEYDTMDSWNKMPYKANGEKNRKHSNPSLEHIMIVLKWANKKITDILG